VPKSPAESHLAGTVLAGLLSIAAVSLLILKFAAPERAIAAPPPYAAGVTEDLAKTRASRITDLVYDLDLVIPDAKEKPIRAKALISMVLRGSGPVILDFEGPRERVESVKLNSKATSWDYANGHLILEAVEAGSVRLEIAFIAGDGPLNRDENYLYSLFVPNRASAAFPCFDQPDLKARYRLALEVPSTWTAVSNGPLLSTESSGGRRRFQFSETRPLSTYLFAFAAGQFRVEESLWKGKPIRFFHRETDEERIKRNLGVIFELHRKALDWLEQYTSIAYAFDKFDFVGIPAFQFSGMEHPGAILYRDSKLFLDESATQTEILERASLIAHETSHMWFGDLVTMRWFNDVWTKEVFANFIAAKIVNPSFPDINHELRFFLAHYPAAYEIDRTAGTHPIRQPLENMNDAASLYGPIIYQKAPIVMRQLETLIGAEAMRSGLRRYLKQFSYANATWPDLVSILDGSTEIDLKQWSGNWVEKEGRPIITTRVGLRQGRVRSIAFQQFDPLGRGLMWPQVITPVVGFDRELKEFRTKVEGKTTDLSGLRGAPGPDFVLPDARGIGYARFELDPESRRYLVSHLHELPDPIARASAWVILYECMVEREIQATDLMTTLRRTLNAETEELNINSFLTSLGQLYWGFLLPHQRADIAAAVEQDIWHLLEAAPSQSLKSAFFKALMAIATTDSGIRRLRDVWAHRLLIPGLSLSEQDEMRLAFQLAIRVAPESEEILRQQSRRIKNPDRKREFEFIAPSVSASVEVRDQFFQSLGQAPNRTHEPWVLEALSYLHHPLRAETAIRYVQPSLELLEETKATGGIFFPKRWLDATLSGHNSEQAADIVRRFLKDHPKYPARLKGKILQSADLLFRKATIIATRSDRR